MLVTSTSLKQLDLKAQHCPLHQERNPLGLTHPLEGLSDNHETDSMTSPDGRQSKTNLMEERGAAACAVWQLCGTQQGAAAGDEGDSPGRVFRACLQHLGLPDALQRTAGSPDLHELT